MTNPIMAVARVQLTVEIALTQPWPPQATFEEAHRRAESQALEIARMMKGLSVVGEPRVMFITFSDKRKALDEAGG